MDELRKIDLIRERLDVSYAEAYQALEKAQGDVVAALIELERKERHHKMSPDTLGKKVWAGMKEFVCRCGKTKLNVKKNGETVLSVPLSLGLAALVGVLSNDDLALAAGFGVAVGTLKGYHVELEDGEQEEEQEFVIIS